MLSQHHRQLLQHLLACGCVQWDVGAWQQVRLAGVEEAGG
jgi:hypothetical protein